MKPSAPRQAGWRSGLLLLTAILCVAYVPMFLGKVIHFRDSAYWSFPVRWFVKQALLGGQSPAWNPYQGLGLAVYADPLYGLHYPPNLLYLVLPLPHAVTWVTFLHLLWGGAGILLLARRFGMGMVASLIAAVVWSLSGFNTSSWTAGLLVPAASWLPWCAVGFTRLVRLAGGGRRALVSGLIGAALPIAMSLLLGEVFYAMMAVGFGLVCGVVYANLTPTLLPLDATARDRRRWWARVMLAAVLALALGTLGGAVTYVPAATVAGASERAQPLKRETAETCSVSPRRLIELVAPGAMGRVLEKYPGYQWMGAKCVSKMPMVFSIYLGAAAAALAFIAFGRGRRLATTLGVLAVVGFVLAMGSFTPVHQLFRTAIRPFAYMRYPEKYLALPFALFSLLAGLGTDRLLTCVLQPWRRTLVLAGGLLAFSQLARFLVAPQMVEFMAPAAMHGAIAAVVVSAAQLLVRSRKRLAAGLLIAAVAVDLSSAAWPIQNFGPASVATTPPPALELMQSDFGARNVPPRLYRGRETDASIGRFYVAESVQEGELRSMLTLLPEPLNAFGVASVPAYDAAASSMLLKVWVAGRPTGQATMRLLSIDYAVMPVENPLAPETRPDLHVLDDPLPGARLYRVDDPLPRAYLASSAVLSGDDKLLRHLYEPEIVSGGRVLLAPDAGARPLAGPVERAGECRIETYRNDRVEISCDARRPAVAVLVDQWSQGWRAQVDGAEHPVLRANGTNRAVFVGPGRHQIEMSYTPPGVQRGRMMSGGAALTILVLLAWLWWSRRRESPVAGALQ